MQIKGLHKNIYRLSAYAASQEKLEFYRKKYENPVKVWLKLKKQGVDTCTIQEITHCSRATFYRYKKVLEALAKGILPLSKRPKTHRKPSWNEAEKQLVLKLRRENPTYGKAKIAVILKRDQGLILSESTVGRILRFLMSKGLVLRSLSAPREKRKRHFKSHAKPWVYGMKASKPGFMVQLDHMTVCKNSFTFKHFQAWDPTSKFIHAALFTNATSRSAKKFLLELIAKAPFKIQSIQVDGGSEFMKDFEEACQSLNIQLFVLPPKRPQYNGGVERGNRTFREEFYANPRLLADSIGAFRFDLTQSLAKYNSFRPHHALHGLTPFEYLNTTYPETLSQSHMY